nr:MAG TPA: hypothetical protein [Caudoviricetes sp.]
MSLRICRIIVLAWLSFLVLLSIAQGEQLRCTSCTLGILTPGEIFCKLETFSSMVFVAFLRHIPDWCIRKG